MKLNLFITKEDDGVKNSGYKYNNSMIIKTKDIPTDCFNITLVCGVIY